MWSAFVDWLRHLILGDLREVVAGMQGEIDGLRAALHDPATIRPLVAAALRGEVRSSPDEIAAALAPVVEQLFERHEAAIKAWRPATRPGRWLWPAAAIVIIAIATLGLRWRSTDANEAAVGSPVAVAASAPVARAMIVEQRAGGFGLGQTRMSDDELAGRVRSRLSTCAELVGASVSFSVKDGWVWLRGEAPAAGREAAGRALADLGEGVFIVNQLVVPAPLDASGQG